MKRWPGGEETTIDISMGGVHIRLWIGNDGAKRTVPQVYDAALEMLHGLKINENLDVAVLADRVARLAIEGLQAVQIIRAHIPIPGGPTVGVGHVVYLVPFVE